MVCDLDSAEQRECREAQRRDSLSVLFLFICSVFTRFSHHYVTLRPLIMLSGMVHSEYFQSFPGAPEGTAGPVSVASAFTLSWLLSLLLLFAFFSVPKIFRGKHISFFCVSLCILFLFLCFSAFTLFFSCNFYFFLMCGLKLYSVVAAPLGNVIKAMSARQGIHL